MDERENQEVNTVSHRNQNQRRQQQRKRLRLMIDISAVILVILLAVLLFWQVGKDELDGTWGANDTYFEFNGKGKGVWIQGDEMEKFNYEINRDTISVDFKRENVRDLTYTFTIEKNQLTLIDSEGEPFTMDRIK